MNPKEFLENQLLLNPLLAPLGIAAQVAGAALEQREAAKKAQQSTEAKPEKPSTQPEKPSTQPDLPTQQPIPPGGASTEDLAAIIRAALEAQGAEARAARQAQLEEAKAAREFYPQRAEIDVDVYRRQAEIAQASALERMREKTARDVELQTISAWQGVTQAQIQRDTAMGLGMMNLAYSAGVPNPNVLTGGAALAGQGRAAFGTPSSLISE